MKIINNIFSILTPCLVCFSLIFFFNIGISYYPLIFAVVIAAFNLRHYKVNKYLGVFLSILFSYLVFFLSVRSFIVIDTIFDSLIKFFKINLNHESIGFSKLVFIISVISPLLLMFSFSYLFDLFQKSISKWIIILSILLLIIITYLKLGHMYLNWIVIISILTQSLILLNKIKE